MHNGVCVQGGNYCVSTLEVAEGSHSCNVVDNVCLVVYAGLDADYQKEGHCLP